MTQALVPCHASPGLAMGNSPHDQASAAFFAELPQLIIDGANLPTTARQLARLLATAGALFERGGHVVRIIEGCDGLQIERLTSQGVVLEAHKVCRPVEGKIRQGAAVRKDVTLPLSVARLYLNMTGDWELPVLKGTSSAPLLSGDGSISCSSGYDRPRGIWCMGFSGSPQVVAQPSFAEAKASLLLLRQTFASFPFADSVRVDTDENPSVDLAQNPGMDESAFLIALLTALCRPSLPLAPALLLRAPQLSGSGTGKGLLIHALAEIAFAQKPKAFTSRGDKQELTKRIEAALLGPGPIVFLDNCNAELLESNVLAQIITEGQVCSRPLGQSKMVALTTNAFIAVTGNAVKISEDLARRFLVVNLDAKCENPEQRRFGQDFEALVTFNRQALLEALLTIWRWGRQNRLQPGLAFGSFGVWASWCRDPMLALGCVDPVQCIAEVKAEDPLRQRIADFFHAWHAMHGSAPVKFRDLDPGVSDLLGGNPQTRVARLQQLENARAGGFVLEAIKPRGAWGKKNYQVRPDTA
jgi:hypothetical protein